MDRCTRTDDHSHELSIRSVLDVRDRTPACLIDWCHAGQTLITPLAALVTARDLMAAAAGAETDIALIHSLREDLRADDDVVAGLLTAVRARRYVPPARAALRIHAVAGANTGKPWVHIARGSMKGELTPAEAREMAEHWIQVAVAAQLDARLRYVLGDYPQLTPTDVEGIFGKLLDAQR